MGNFGVVCCRLGPARLVVCDWECALGVVGILVVERVFWGFAQLSWRMFTVCVPGDLGHNSSEWVNSLNHYPLYLDKRKFGTDLADF